MEPQLLQPASTLSSPRLGRDRRQGSAPGCGYLARGPPLQGGALFPAAPCPPPTQELGRSVSSPTQATTLCLCGTEEAARAVTPAVDGDAVVTTGLRSQGSCSRCSRCPRSAVSSGSVPRHKCCRQLAPLWGRGQQRRQSASLGSSKRPTRKASLFTLGSRPRQSLQEACQREAQDSFSIIRGSVRTGQLCSGAQASPRIGSKHVVQTDDVLVPRTESDWIPPTGSTYEASVHPQSQDCSIEAFPQAHSMLYS